MELVEIMAQLKKMGIAMFATTDMAGQPHVRPIHVGVANAQGIFFMTHPETDFHHQLETNPKVAIVGFSESGYLIQVIRVEGDVRPIGREQLAELLAGNPYVDQVYPEDSSREALQVYHCYRGQVSYQSLTQGHRYHYEFGKTE